MSNDGSEGMTLGRLRDAGVGGRVHGTANATVRGVQHDSRHVSPGDLFVAVTGETHDGARFADAAVAAGAHAIMTERVLECDVPQLVVSDARAALGKAAEVVYG